MKSTIYFFVCLIAVSTSICMRSLEEVYEIIETSDADKFRELSNSMSFSMTKEQKRAFVQAARKKAFDRQLQVSNFTPKDVARLLLGLRWAVTGGLYVSVSLGVLIGLSAMGAPKLGIAGAAPLIAFGALPTYLAIDNIAKAVTHYDNKIRYDRALAIESMLKHIKAKPEQNAQLM